MKKYSLAICLAFIASFGFAQTACNQYHRKNCADKEAGKAMRYDSQSKSAVLGKGQISEFHMVAYHDLDYRITVCAEEILGDKIQFKIYEKKRVLIKDEEKTSEEESTSEEEYSEDDYSEDSYEEEASSPKKKGPQFRMVKELLYDNAEDSYNNKLEFTAEGSMSLIIEISVPGTGSASKLKIRETGCVGVLIEHVKTRKAGF